MRSDISQLFYVSREIHRAPSEPLKDLSTDFNCFQRPSKDL
jgi:hypothetical protein